MATQPAVLRLYLAGEFKRRREAAGKSRQDVAQHLGCSLSHVTHLEIARSLPKRPELRDLLAFVGAGERFDHFDQLVHAAEQGTDWWLPFKGAAPSWFDLYLGLEASASRIESYDAVCIPGLFQTAAYAADVIRAGRPDLTAEAVAQRVDLRMARQDVLVRQPHPPAVISVLDESVLHRTSAGGGEVLAEQLEHLLKIMTMPTVAIRVLPLTAAVAAGLSGTITLMTFDAQEMPGHAGMGYAEDPVRGAYYDQPEEVARFRQLLDGLADRTYTEDKTRALVAARVEELRT